MAHVSLDRLIFLSFGINEVPPFFHRSVKEPPFFIVRVYHHPKGTTFFYMVATTSRV